MNRRRLTELCAVVVLGGALAAFAATAGTRSAGAHRMAPAIGPAAHYQRLGKATLGQAAPTFSCQVAQPAQCYGPAQIRKAYGIQPLLDEGYDGSGRTIVIVDAYGSPTIERDLALFDAVFELPAPPGFRIVEPFGVGSPSAEDAIGWGGETTLDVEWAHAVAPGASILLVVAKSADDGDILDATQWVLDHDAGDVLSQSFGEAEQCMDPVQLARQHVLFRDLTRQAVTLFASAGDSGAGQPDCGTGETLIKAASAPASDPFVTGVGGTELDANGVTGEYDSETTWNESDLGLGPLAGGGGVSVVYTRPSYQAPVSKEKMRTVPDVSYDAGIFTGVLAVWTRPDLGGTFFFVFGGTSAGSPQWAGITAIADQIAGTRVGAVNKALYDVGKNRKSSTYFHDVADGSDNSVPGVEGFTAVPGYDLATGLGTPIASTLAPYLAKAGARGDDGNGWGSVARTQGGANGKHGHEHPN